MMPPGKAGDLAQRKVQAQLRS